MTSLKGTTSWIRAVTDAAADQQTPLPPFVIGGMGTAVCRDPVTNRFVSFRRPLVSLHDARGRGVDWAAWSEEEGSPSPVLIVREPLHPTPDRINVVLTMLRGWLVDRWDADTLRRSIDSPALDLAHAPVAPGGPSECQLTRDGGFTIAIHHDGWTIDSRGRSLSKSRSRDADGAEAGKLTLESLDKFCGWLARNWLAIAYGADVRPAVLRDSKATASRAYETARRMRPTAHGEADELSGWWSRHAARDADCDLPNLFLERQADDVIVSWDASPSAGRFFTLSTGEEALPVDYCIPALRNLVRSRLKVMPLTEPDRATLMATASSDITVAYRALRLSPSCDD